MNHFVPFSMLTLHWLTVIASGPYRTCANHPPTFSAWVAGQARKGEQLSDN